LDALIMTPPDLEAPAMREVLAAERRRLAG
jgi:hypothetical protein